MSRPYLLQELPKLVYDNSVIVAFHDNTSRLSMAILLLREVLLKDVSSHIANILINTHEHNNNKFISLY